MVKLCSDTLREALDLSGFGWSFQQIAEHIGTSRQLLYTWRDRSIAHANGAVAAHVSPFFLIYGDPPVPGFFHDFLAQARDTATWQTDPSLADCTDEDLLALGITDRLLRDDAGNLVPLERDEEPEIFRDDIEELRAAALEKPKNKPTGPAGIAQGVFRARHDSDRDLPERLTGAASEVSQVERERALPRAHMIDQDLHPAQPPSYAKPRPIEGYSERGNQTPPDTMRMTVATRTYNFAERIHHGPLGLRNAKGELIS
jgi:hypothetical protein